MRTLDITGKKFGSLTALRLSHVRNGMAHWEYLCDCGNTHIARANTVTYRAVREQNSELPSCGCVELRMKTKHGFRKVKDTHPCYRAYGSMMSRCEDSNNPTSKWYKDKGVTVCSEWLNSPEVFVEWSLANGWKPGLHIDKDIICEAKGISPKVYSPETCQWVSAKTNVGFSTNRHNFGSHPNVRLSQESVDEILRLYHSGEITNKSELARMYGLKSPSSIGRLIELNKVSLTN